MATCDGLTEFDAGDPEATMHAMAIEILRYRHVMVQLADAIAWAQAGAPFATLGPGPHWQPQTTRGIARGAGPPRQ